MACPGAYLQGTSQAFIERRHITKETVRSCIESPLQNNTGRLCVCTVLAAVVLLVKQPPHLLSRVDMRPDITLFYCSCRGEKAEVTNRGCQQQETGKAAVAVVSPTALNQVPEA